MDNLELIAPSILVVLFTAYVRLRLGSFLAPAAFFSLVWTIHVILSFVVPYYPVWSGTLWWILLTCVFLYLGTELGTLLGSRSKKPGLEAAGPPKVQFRWPVASLIVCFVCAVGYSVWVRLAGLELSLEKPPVYMQTLLPFQFAGPMLGGMLFGGGSLRGRRTWLTLLPLIPPAILAVLYTGRTTIVAPILSWIAAYFAVRIYVHRSYRGVLGPKHFFAAFALLALLLGIGVGLQHLRKLRRPNSSAAEMVDTYAHDASWQGMISEWDRFRYFAFGQVYSFSWYFEQAWRVPPEPKMGTMIFAGPIDLLGYGDRTASWVDSFEAERGIYTNVFTMLRPPMDDFGLIGSLFWWLAIGTIQGWAHVLARRGVVPVITLMIWFYLDISLIGGLFFRYNSVIIAYLLIAWYLTRATVHQRSPVLARGLGARRALQATP